MSAATLLAVLCARVFEISRAEEEAAARRDALLANHAMGGIKRRETAESVAKQKE
jgi:hypothetical protein